MSTTELAGRRVWPVNPGRWEQEGHGWAGELQFPPTPDCGFEVAVKLPDGLLVGYDVRNLGRFKRDWRLFQVEFLDYQI